MHFTGSELGELIAGSLLAVSVVIFVLTLALRFGVRPLLEDWAKMRAQLSGGLLERRLTEMEDDIRQLKAASSLQLPAELRSTERPRV